MIAKTVKMGVAGKLLFLLVAVTALQEICAWPPFFIWKWKNLEYEVNKASDDAERDVRKDLLSAKNSAWKDTNKLISKVRDNFPTVTCIITSQQNSLMEMDNISLNAVECIENIRDKANKVEDENYSPRDLILMKNSFKNKIKSCRNEARDKLKVMQKQFSESSRVCLNPGREKDDSSSDDGLRSS